MGARMADYRPTRGFQLALALIICMISVSARAAYDCENDDVVSSAVGLLLCENDDCSNFGVEGGYEALKQMDDDKLGNRLSNLYKQRYAGQLPGNLVQRISDEHRGLFLTQRRLFKNIRSTAIDYNSRISRYECEAVAPYNREVREVMIKHRAFVGMIEEGNGILLMQANPQLFEASVRAVFNRLMQTFPTQRRFRFAVQPSSKGGYTVSLIE